MNRREALGSLTLGVASIALGVRAACDQGRPRGDGLPDELHADDYRRYFAPHEDVEVTLDSVVLRYCTAANRAQGWADVIAVDTDGNVIVDYDAEEPRIVRMRGRVAFRRVPVEELIACPGNDAWEAYKCRGPEHAFLTYGEWLAKLNIPEPQGGQLWRA